MYKAKYVKQVNCPTRNSYAKIGGTYSLPNLIEVQTKSFEWFVNEGIKEVFEDVFPIESGKISLHYLDCYFGEPKHTENECKNNDLNYTRPLYANLLLKNSATGAMKKLSTAFMGDFPWMTDTGTFIINGAERVIVSQIVRSAGVVLV